MTKTIKQQEQILKYMEEGKEYRLQEFCELLGLKEARTKEILKPLTGVSNYKGRSDQIETVMEHITAENYANMRERVCNLETRDTVTGSSNFGRFMEFLTILISYKDKKRLLLC